MKFKTRRQVRPGHTNHNGTLFGGLLIQWIDEEAAIYCECQLETKSIVTKAISEINFVSPARVSDVVEIGVEAIAFGNTSITVKVEVRNKDTGMTIIKIDRMTFVSIGPDGQKISHGKTQVREM